METFIPRIYRTLLFPPKRKHSSTRCLRRISEKAGPGMNTWESTKEPGTFWHTEWCLLLFAQRSQFLRLPLIRKTPFGNALSCDCCWCCCRCVASVASDSVRPHRRQPTRLPLPWDSPGKNTGVGCLSFSNAWKWKVKVKSLSCVRPLSCDYFLKFQ